MLRQITILLFSVTLLTACSKINQDNFDRISTGMSGAEVRGVLGESTESGSIDIGFVRGTRSVWRDGDVVIKITFVQDKVQTKSFTKTQVAK